MSDLEFKRTVRRELTLEHIPVGAFGHADDGQRERRWWEAASVVGRK